MRYADILAFTEAGLTNLGYGQPGGPPMPAFHPGPPSLTKLHTLTPGSRCFLTVGNGIGFTKEGLYEQKFITVRVIGAQNNYNSAEDLAYAIDGLYFPVETQKVGDARVLYITRNAPPQLVDCDAAERYHFNTTYITECMR